MIIFSPTMLTSLNVLQSAAGCEPRKTFTIYICMNVLCIAFAYSHVERNMNLVLHIQNIFNYAETKSAIIPPIFVIHTINCSNEVYIYYICSMYNVLCVKQQTRF